MRAYEAYLPLPSNYNQPTHYDQLVATAVNNTLEAQPYLKRCIIQDKLLIWHQILAHILSKNLKHMATLGQILTCLAKVSPQKFPSCIVGKATKIPGRVKGANSKIRKTTKSCKCISGNQLESSTPGLIAQWQ
jgi:hypothetical protein